jgi:hypothetical protein
VGDTAADTTESESNDDFQPVYKRVAHVKAKRRSGELGFPFSYTQCIYLPSKTLRAELSFPAHQSHRTSTLRLLHPRTSTHPTSSSPSFLFPQFPSYDPYLPTLPTSPPPTKISLPHLQDSLFSAVPSGDNHAHARLGNMQGPASFDMGTVK